MRLLKLQIGILALAGAMGCGEVIDGVGPDAAPQPAAMGISPDHGPLVGGTTVTLSGFGFQTDAAGVPRVVVGGVEAMNVAVVSDTEVTFEAPPGSQEGELVDVTVFNQAGFTLLPEAFRYNLQPSFDTISPTVGPILGGTTVTIEGHGFLADEAGSPTVLFDGVAATSVSVVDDTTLTAVTPPTPTAAPFSRLDIDLSNANGSTALDDAFRVTKQGLLALDLNGGAALWIEPTDGTIVNLPRTGTQTIACTIGPAETYFCTTANNQLTSYEPITGVMAPIGPLLSGGSSTRIRGLAFAGTTLYGYSCDTQLAYSINTTTGELTAVSGAIAAGRPAMLTPKDASAMYFMDRTDQQLRTVSTTGVVTAGPVMNGDGTQIMSAMSDGTTMFLTDRSLRLFSVNVTSGALTLLAQMPVQVHALMKTPSSF